MDRIHLFISYIVYMFVIVQIRCSLFPVVMLIPRRGQESRTLTLVPLEVFLPGSYTSPGVMEHAHKRSVVKSDQGVKLLELDDFLAQYLCFGLQKALISVIVTCLYSLQLVGY